MHINGSCINVTSETGKADSGYFLTTQTSSPSFDRSQIIFITRDYKYYLFTVQSWELNVKGFGVPKGKRKLFSLQEHFSESRVSDILYTHACMCMHTQTYQNLPVYSVF